MASTLQKTPWPVPGRESKHKSICLCQLMNIDDWYIRLGRSVHLLQHYLRKGLGNLQALFRSGDADQALHKHHPCCKIRCQSAMGSAVGTENHFEKGNIYRVKGNVISKAKGLATGISAMFTWKTTASVPSTELIPFTTSSTSFQMCPYVV